MLELVGANRVFERVSADNGKGRVVTPLVWIADLVHDAMQFLLGASLCFGTHPIEGVDVFVHCGFNGDRHGESALFFLRRKESLYISLAQSFTEFTVNAAGAPLPAGLLFLRSIQDVRVEVPVLVIEAFGKGGAREGIEQMPA